MRGCSKCPTHGDQYLTREQYMAQSQRAATSGRAIPVVNAPNGVTITSGNRMGDS